jgi:beta-lactamase regulating signal transducer with metallopeptidase domain
MEPGVFGIIRPVLLWPEGIARHMDDAHLESVLAHEVCHVQRRDNLTSAIHMLVEAIFWFHPVVWWMERQLVKERELACDEAVLQLGNEAAVYAESILND